MKKIQPIRFTMTLFCILVMTGAWASMEPPSSSGAYEVDLTVYIVGNGTATITPVEIVIPNKAVVFSTCSNTDDQPCVFTFLPYTRVQIEHEAGPGWAFSDIDVEYPYLTKAEGPLEILLFGPTTVTVTFVKESLDLDVNVSPADGGSVDVDPPGPYFYDDIVTLTAIPAPGKVFLAWVGDFTQAPAKSPLTSNPLEIIMQDDSTVTALFEDEVVPVPLKNLGILIGGLLILVSMVIFFRRIT